MKQFLALLSISLIFFNIQADELLALEESAVIKTHVSAEKSVKSKKFYAAALIGMAAYPEVTNVNKGYNASVAMGYHFDEQIMLDWGLGLAKSQLSVKNLLFANQRDTFDINQYQANLGAKYRLDGLFGSDFIPVAGLTASYTYRKYNMTNNLAVISGNTGSSTALDAGLNAGIDYDVSKSITMGVDIRYMFNLSHQISSNYINPTYGYYGTPLESLQYYVAGVAARMIF